MSGKISAFGGKGNRLGGENPSDADSAAKGDAPTVRATVDASANIQTAYSLSYITVDDYVQPEVTHETYNYFDGVAGNNAGAWGGNANLGSQEGAHIYIGAAPQSPPINQAALGTVSGIDRHASRLHDCTIT